MIMPPLCARIPQALASVAVRRNPILAQRRTCACGLLRASSFCIRLSSTVAAMILVSPVAPAFVTNTRPGLSGGAKGVQLRTSEVSKGQFLQRAWQGIVRNTAQRVFRLRGDGVRRVSSTAVAYEKMPR